MLLLLLLQMIVMVTVQEREALERKQAWYQQVHPSDMDKEREYLAFCNDTKQRLHVSELRLNRSSQPLQQQQQQQQKNYINNNNNNNNNNITVCRACQ